MHESVVDLLASVMSVHMLTRDQSDWHQRLLGNEFPSPPLFPDLVSQRLRDSFKPEKGISQKPQLFMRVMHGEAGRRDPVNCKTRWSTRAIFP